MIKSNVKHLENSREIPEIPGLKFRKFRGEVDYPAMLAVIEASKDMDKIERTDTLEDITRNYQHLVNCDPYRDMLFGEIDGEVIGYNRVFWEQQKDGTQVYTHFGFLVPAWRGQGIGRAMLRQAERRLREIAVTHPEDGPRLLQSWASETETEASALLESEGYQAVRHFFEMVRDLSDPFPQAPMPDGLVVRPVESSELWQIFEASNEAFSDHWGARDATPTEFEGWMKDPYFEPRQWKVAWDGDQVAGMVLNFINSAENEEYNRKRGWTDPICVRRPWRRRGLARSLIVQSLQYLKELGMEEAALGVDTENLSGALRLYEGVRYRQVKRFSTYQKPLDNNGFQFRGKFL